MSEIATVGQQKHGASHYRRGCRCEVCESDYKRELAKDAIERQRMKELYAKRDRLQRPRIVLEEQEDAAGDIVWSLTGRGKPVLSYCWRTIQAEIEERTYSDEPPGEGLRRVVPADVRGTILMHNPVFPVVFEEDAPKPTPPPSGNRARRRGSLANSTLVWTEPPTVAVPHVAPEPTQKPDYRDAPEMERWIAHSWETKGGRAGVDAQGCVRSGSLPWEEWAPKYRKALPRFIKQRYDDCGEVKKGSKDWREWAPEEIGSPKPDLPYIELVKGVE